MICLMVQRHKGHEITGPLASSARKQRKTGGSAQFALLLMAPFYSAHNLSHGAVLPHTEDLSPLFSYAFFKILTPYFTLEIGLPGDSRCSQVNHEDHNW